MIDIGTKILEFSFFKELAGNAQAIADLVKILKHEVFEMRDFIIDENKDDYRMFFLISGQAVINKMDENGQQVTLGKADASSHPYFGESSILGKFRKSANVVAYTRCECLSLSAKDFEQYMISHPYVVASIYRNLASVLYDRLTKANKDNFIQALKSRQ